MAEARGAPAAGDPPLTPRESEVLEYLRLRLTNREIADRLVVSTRTVESHVSSLLAKLGKTSRRALAATPTPALDRVIGKHGGLPDPLDSFIGRGDDLDALAELLRSHRLVTLVGPPGVGKTRLAVEVSRRVMARFAGGVRFVEFAPVTDGAGVADRLLVAVGARQVPGQDVLAMVGAQAPDAPVLVLIDNCEHVLTAAAAVVQSLLNTWPLAVALVTSREPLRIPGELIRPVRPLTLPDPTATEPARVLAAESVRLLLDRASASGAGVSVTDANAAAVALLCRSLDGLPLALELAAGRLRTFTPDQLADRLDARQSLLADTGGGSRDRTLRAAIERSYAGLTSSERSLFTALSVFPGTFTMEAVENVFAEIVPPDDAAETFCALVDRSLVSVVPTGAVNRYRLLDTLHVFAAEKLPIDLRALLSRRHALYFLDVAEQAEPGLHGREAQEWLSRLRVEQDNLTHALEWALRNEPVLALRMVGALWQFWQDTDQRRSGIEWAEQALATVADGPADVRLKALLAAATLVAPWDASRCSELVAEANRLGHDLGDAEWRARTQLLAVMSTVYSADPSEEERAAARQAAHDAVGYFRAAGDQWRAAEVLNPLSMLQSHQDAIVTLAEARRLYELEGDELRAANCAYMTAAILVRELDDARRGEQLAEEAVAMAARVGSEHETAHARSILAEVHLRNGMTKLATEIATDCLTAFRRAADHRCVSAMLLLLGTAAAQMRDDDTAREHLQEALDTTRLGAHARTVRDTRAQLAALDARRPREDETSPAP